MQGDRFTIQPCDDPPVNWLPTVASAIIGVVVGGVIGPFLTPWARKAERAGELVAGENPVDVLIDTDQAVIWAGSPPWVGFSYYFEDALPTEDPPDVSFDWSKWAYRHRGVDVALTMIRVTIQARLKATVVLDTPIVRVVDRQEITRGFIATCPAGGADIVPRHFEVDLDLFDPPIVHYMDENQQPVTSPGFKLASGDVERFHIWVRTRGNDLVEWSLDLPIIVNGKRQELPVQGPTALTFKTAGDSAHVREVLRSGQDWVSRRREGHSGPSESAARSKRPLRRMSHRFPFKRRS